VAKITELPAQLRRSLTWDQGREMAQHAAFTIASGVPVYFCDPRSPWQRGSNENTNGLLRQYLPRNTRLAECTQAELDHIAAELNGRPRQTPGWKTPSQALDRTMLESLSPHPLWRVIASRRARHNARRRVSPNAGSGSRVSSACAALLGEAGRCQM